MFAPVREHGTTKDGYVSACSSCGLAAVAEVAVVVAAHCVGGGGDCSSGGSGGAICPSRATSSSSKFALLSKMCSSAERSK